MSEKLFITGLTNSFRTHKVLAENAFRQLDHSGLHWHPTKNTNTVAIVIKHIAGHLKSRFTDFFNSDGERKDRNRNQEIIDEEISIVELEQLWENSWQTVFYTLDNLYDKDLSKIKILRGDQIIVADYIPRVLTHFTYHTGQIVCISKQYLKDQWKPL